MSLKLQQTKMRTIYNLVSQDLGYIFGELESGPNGAKKKFHAISAAFLKALAKDLGFQESKVTNNHGGIAVSGEITLRGMWSDKGGLYFMIEQPFPSIDGFLYRSIKHMKDYTGGSNRWLSLSLFADGDYEQLIKILSALSTAKETVCHVA